MSQTLIPPEQEAKASSSANRPKVVTPDLGVALLTAGQDKPYALGIGPALASKGILVDFIGSDIVDGPMLHNNPLINFLNLRGEQSRAAGFGAKVTRIFKYYARLISYTATAKPKVFHILWNNKFEVFDRIFLMLYYRLLGRRITFTAHNINAGKRDANDSWINRYSLTFQYSMVHHIFVHTDKMKSELISEFQVPSNKISVIPFGINNTLPNTELTRAQARKDLGLGEPHKTMLFFGNIAPYKGLEHLIAALVELAKKDENYRLIIAGSVKDCADYWQAIQDTINRTGLRDKLIEKIGYIPDNEAERYFKAADVLILPYNHIFQSGVLFLGYSFGLPVIATDVGSLKNEIVEGETGSICQPQDPASLGKAISNYFSSTLYQNLERKRADIRDYANDRYSWDKVAEISKKVYLSLLQ